MSSYQKQHDLLPSRPHSCLQWLHPFSVHFGENRIPCALGWLVTNLSLMEYTRTHYQMMTTWKILSFRYFFMSFLIQPKTRRFLLSDSTKSPPIHFILLYFSLSPVRLFPLLLITRKHVVVFFFSFFSVSVTLFPWFNINATNEEL